jgi:hypothetical protein
MKLTNEKSRMVNAMALSDAWPDGLETALSGKEVKRWGRIVARRLGLLRRPVTP